MRILDLDLDFFLNEVPYFRSRTDGRCDSERYRPWTEKRVRDFLTSNCGLRCETPIPGRFVTHHDEAFAIWRELILAKTLVPPLQVVHIDSHADLGNGDGGFKYLMGDILHREPNDRFYPDAGVSKMNYGNYLAFAMACRWFNKVTYVVNPNGKDDHFQWYFRNGDSQTEVVEFKAVDPADLKNLETTLTLQPTEPTIPFHTVNCQDYLDDGNFDFMILCHSPSFTPKESDALIPVIRTFMNENCK